MNRFLLFFLTVPFFVCAQNSNKQPINKVTVGTTIMDGNHSVCKKYFEANKTTGKAKDSIVGSRKNLFLEDGYSEKDYFGDLMRFQPEFQKKIVIPYDLKPGENRIRIWVGFKGNYEKIEKLKVSDEKIANQMVN